MSDQPEPKKTLLPEFLPTPGATPASDPRTRVAARMRALLRKTAAVSTAAVCMSCVSVDPIPPPSDVTMNPLDGDGGPDAPTDASIDAAGDAATDAARSDGSSETGGPDGGTDGG